MGEASTGTANEPVKYPWHYLGVTIAALIMMHLFLPRIVINLMVIGSTFWVYFDGRRRKIPNAGAWMVGTLVLWIAIFPWYMYRRRYPQRPCPTIEQFSWKIILTIVIPIAIAATVTAFIIRLAVRPSYPSLFSGSALSAVEEATRAVKAKTYATQEKTAMNIMHILRMALRDYAGSEGYDRATLTERYPRTLNALVATDLTIEKDGMTVIGAGYRFIYSPNDDLTMFSLRAEPLEKGRNQRIFEANQDGYGNGFEAADHNNDTTQKPIH